MQLVGVRVELPTNNPIVLLREADGDHRVLPIFIGAVEATAIAFALQGVVTQRPMTHDLMRDLLMELGIGVDRIVITELRDGTFYAEIEMASNGSQHTVSSRRRALFDHIDALQAELTRRYKTGEASVESLLP